MQICSSTTREVKPVTILGVWRAVLETPVPTFMTSHGTFRTPSLLSVGLWHAYGLAAKDCICSRVCLPHTVGVRTMATGQTYTYICI